MEKDKIKLLVVDDDQFLLGMYSLKFSNNGYEVTTCASPQEALDKLKDGLNPDIILLDVIMPGIDGLQLLETIRNEKLAEKSVVLMLTNQGDRMEKAKELKVDGYIIKATATPSEVVTQVTDIIHNTHKINV